MFRLFLIFHKDLFNNDVETRLMDTCDSLERDLNNLFPPGGIDAKLDITLFFNVNIIF